VKESNIPSLKSIKLGIIGLGYVGLPLAVEFAKYRSVIGYDVDKKRVEDLKNSLDRTMEVSKDDIPINPNLFFTYDTENLKQCNCFIVTVPTPINEDNKPDLNPLLSASKLIGSILSEGDIVIYESTVYPGATENDCVPVLEEYSGLKFNQDFFCGYSPERVNPGDKQRKISDIVKITSGSTPEVGDLVDLLYCQIVRAGTYKAESIKIAEAAKVIENTQRDVNIALMNELAIIFASMGINTDSVLKAAETKWNFLPFRPGLVGGHCIPVDPYYLIHQAQTFDCDPMLISSARHRNSSMPSFIFSQLMDSMKDKKINVQEASVLIMGLTFKEDCADVRNSGVIHLYDQLNRVVKEIDVVDPWADADSAFMNFGIRPKKAISMNSKKYDVIILAVSHQDFKEMGLKNIKYLAKENSIFYDLKSIFPDDLEAIRL
jgi:UDP-N-acetyl-D-galactosamine dehydrogenase